MPTALLSSQSRPVRRTPFRCSNLTPLERKTHICHILPPSEIGLFFGELFLQAQKGDINFAELAEKGPKMAAAKPAPEPRHAGGGDMGLIEAWQVVFSGKIRVRMEKSTQADFYTVKSQAAALLSSLFIVYHCCGHCSYVAARRRTRRCGWPARVHRPGASCAPLRARPAPHLRHYVCVPSAAEVNDYRTNFESSKAMTRHRNKDNATTTNQNSCHADRKIAACVFYIRVEWLLLFCRGWI